MHHYTAGDLVADPLAQGIYPSSHQQLVHSPSTALLNLPESSSRGRAVSSASDSAAHWRQNGYHGPPPHHHDPRFDAPGTSELPLLSSMGQSSSDHPFHNTIRGSSSPQAAAAAAAANKEAELERALVGSLKSSYPFAKDGLCKKTISIQVEGSTQHLISYYKVDDVRSGRLRTPLSLPEIAGLNISPMILQKSNFRNPPDIEVLPDGTLRYRGDGSESARRLGAGTGSGSEGSNDGRPLMAGPSYPSQSSPISPMMVMDPGYASVASFDGRSGPTMQSAHYDQGGSNLARRFSMASSGYSQTGSSRYEPYAHPSSASSRPTAIPREAYSRQSQSGGSDNPSAGGGYWFSSVSNPTVPDQGSGNGYNTDLLLGPSSAGKAKPRFVVNRETLSNRPSLQQLQMHAQQRAYTGGSPMNASHMVLPGSNVKAEGPILDSEGPSSWQSSSGLVGQRDELDELARARGISGTWTQPQHFNRSDQALGAAASSNGSNIRLDRRPGGGSGNNGMLSAGHSPQTFNPSLPGGQSYEGSQQQGGGAPSVVNSSPLLETGTMAGMSIGSSYLGSYAGGNTNGMAINKTASMGGDRAAWGPQQSLGLMLEPTPARTTTGSANGGQGIAEWQGSNRSHHHHHHQQHHQPQTASSNPAGGYADTLHF